MPRHSTHQFIGIPVIINKFIKQCNKCNQVKLNHENICVPWVSVFLTCDCFKNDKFYHIATIGVDHYAFYTKGPHVFYTKGSYVLNNINKWNNYGWG